MRNKLIGLILMTWLLCCDFLLSAQASVISENAYARESIPGSSVTAAYMTLKNTGQHKLQLVAATSGQSDRIEIHEHIMHQGMMRMQLREFVDIAAKESVTFQPAGYHLMIFDVKQPLKAGNEIMIRLHFNDSSYLDVNYLVSGPKQRNHQHHH